MAIIVTNDSDLLEPIKIVKTLGKNFLILCPHQQYCHEFFQFFGPRRMRMIHNSHLKKAQFSDELLDDNGKVIAQRPNKWK